MCTCQVPGCSGTAPIEPDPLPQYRHISSPAQLTGGILPRGGIITRGESGPEALVPLPRGYLIPRVPPQRGLVGEYEPRHRADTREAS